MYWWLDSRGSRGPRQSHGTAGWRAGQAVPGSVQWSPDKKGNGPSKPRGAVSFAKEIDTLARLAIFYLVAAAAGGSAAAGLASRSAAVALAAVTLEAATQTLEQARLLAARFAAALLDDAAARLAAGGSAAAGLAGGLTTNRLTTLRLAAATKQTGFGTRGGQGEESEGQQEGCTDALDHEEDS
jgi:hypothetical protein